MDSLITKFLFEDNSRVKMTDLFRKGFTESAVKHLDFTDGAGNLLTHAKNHLKKGFRVVIYLDLVIDNENTIRTLKDILTWMYMNPEYKDKIIIVPIFCREYCLLQSLAAQNIANTNDNIIKACLELQGYRQFNIPNKFKRSFEQFCKYVVGEYKIQCTRNAPYTMYKHLKELYFSKSCICVSSAPFPYCHRLDLEAKSKSFIEAYPLIPLRSLDKGWKRLTEKQARCAMKKLLDLHRKTITTFGKSLDPVRIAEFNSLLDALDDLYG